MTDKKDPKTDAVKLSAPEAFVQAATVPLPQYSGGLFSMSTYTPDIPVGGLFTFD